MKKYKLIKEYPGSPKLETIWDEYSTDCPKYPEFWQEITKPEYTILSFTCPRCKYEKIDDTDLFKEVNPIKVDKDMDGQRRKF